MIFNSLKIVFLSSVMTIPTLYFYDNYSKISNFIGVNNNSNVIIEDKVILKNDNIVVDTKTLKEKRNQIKKEKEKVYSNTFNKKMFVKKIENNNNNINNSRDNIKQTKTNINKNEFTDFTDIEIEEATNAVNLMTEMSMKLNVSRAELDVCFKELNTKKCEELITNVLTENYKRQ